MFLIEQLWIFPLTFSFVWFLLTYLAAVLMLRLTQTQVLMLSHLLCVHPDSESDSFFSRIHLIKFFRLALHKTELPSTVSWYTDTPCTKSSPCQQLLVIKFGSNMCPQIIYTWDGSIKLKASNDSVSLLILLQFS